uniref:Uncharacterized protein n=1 Tax=Ananas comosus var. bracteatus TaxID=296719 RepID=A0A6V7NZW9_ANACO|nr:unnamed protein product [Ananas comosus var. bracteatus]
MITEASEKLIGEEKPPQDRRGEKIGGGLLRPHHRRRRHRPPVDGGVERELGRVEARQLDDLAEEVVVVGGGGGGGVGVGGKEEAGVHGGGAGGGGADLARGGGGGEGGRGRAAASSGKLRAAAGPLTQSAAASWARAAISGVGKVPSQMRVFFRGSRISDTHFPHARMRTPRYDGCRVLPAPRPRFVGAPGLVAALELGGDIALLPGSAESAPPLCVISALAGVVSLKFVLARFGRSGLLYIVFTERKRREMGFCFRVN